MPSNGHVSTAQQNSKSTALVEINTLSEDNQAINPADHDGVTSDYSIEVNSRNTIYTNEFIESKYIYEMNHCEVDHQAKQVKIIPRKYHYNFRTKRQVQRTGVMLAGWGGNNGSTVTGAIIANRDNITWMRKEGEQHPNYYGSLTQSTTIRLGSNNEGKEVHIPFNTILPMLHPNDIVIGGWDINGANLGDAMQRACVFDYALQEKLKAKMSKLKPLPSIYYPDFIAANQEDRADNLIPKGTKQQDLEHLRNDIRTFKKAHNLEQVIILWTANTERYVDVRPGLNTTSEEILRSIAANEDEISPSNIFACAAILENCPYINGSPQNTLVPGIIELAEKRQVFIGGDDFKSGQTKLKSVLADFLVSAGLKLQSIVSYNHLGNNDGKNLSAPQQFRSKEISKSNVVDDMVGANHLLYNKKINEHPDHVVVIKYVPFVRDSKRAMDEYISSIFMNGLNTIAIHNTCEDSLLASPLIIDLVILTELMTRITYKTNDEEEYQSFEAVLAILSYLLKAPLVPAGTPVINALFKQHRCITNIFSACNSGTLGARGIIGDVGLPGALGLNGPPGSPGTAGSQGPPGDTGDGSFVFTRHSQDKTTPQCPFTTTKMQDGYSFMGMQGDTYAAHQDLGSFGSCLRRFSAMPFLFCDIGNSCHYASRKDYSYWLSTNEPMSSTMAPFEARDLPNHSSRCVVCESPTPVFAIYSQSQRVPSCPDGYDLLWSGYSFVFTSADGGRGDQQSLQSPGSCLEKYHDRPYFHCKDHSHCNYYPNMMTFYLAALDEYTGFEKPKLLTLKAGTQRQYVSRCAVCHANLFKQTASGPSGYFAQLKKI